MLLALKFRGDLLGPSLSEHCHAHAALNVFARGPEWASLAQELGGEKLNVFQRDDRGTGPEPLGGALLRSRPWPLGPIALRHARDTYTRRMEGVSLWVVRSSDIAASDPEQAGPMFEPAETKIYRHPTFYDLPDAVKHM